MSERTSKLAALQVRIEQSEAELHEQIAAKADRSTLAQAENMVEDIANPSPKP